MSEHRYILQPYSGKGSRYDCPSCGGKLRFTRYVDTLKNEYAHPNCGKCDRENNCGYHKPPKEFSNNQQPIIVAAPIAQKSGPPDFIHWDIAKMSFKDYGHNNFVLFLLQNFDKTRVWQAVDEYLIGTHHHWPSSTVFWQVDIENRIRSGKIMLYSYPGGKRVKEPFPHITWVHKQINPRFNLKQCLFGEHQLNRYPHRKVAIVESEKTAIIASLVYDEYIWLACGSLNAINMNLFAPLVNRKVVLFPDLMGMEKWQERANKLDFKVRVSDFLELRMLPEEKKAGLDLADYILLRQKGEKREDRTPIKLLQQFQSHI